VTVLSTTNKPCTPIQIVSDTQIVCALPAIAAGLAYTVSVVGIPATATDNTASTISSSATYTVAAF